MNGLLYQGETIMPNPKTDIHDHQSNPNEHILTDKGRAKQTHKNHPDKNNIADKESIGRPKTKHHNR